MKQASRVGLAGTVVASCVVGAALLGAGGCSFSNSTPSGAPDAHFGAEGGGFEASVPDSGGAGDDGGGKGDDGGTAGDGGGHEGGGEGGAADGGCTGGGGPGTWTCIGSMGTARTAPGIAALPGGKALVAGGWNATDKVLTTAEVYNGVTQGFTPTGSMKGPHLWAGWGLTWPVLAGGKVLAAGGLDSSGALVAGAELYDPAAGTFTATGPLVTPVISMFPVVLGDGTALFIGGGTGPTTHESNIEDFDPTAGKWTSVGTLASPLYCTQAFLLPGGKVLLVGDGSTADSDILDPATFTTTPTTGFLASWAPLVAQLAGGDVLAFGGTLAGATTTKTMVLHAAGTAWTATGDLREPRGGSAVATALGTGEVLVVGGSDAAGNVLATAELYHP